MSCLPPPKKLNELLPYGFTKLLLMIITTIIIIIVLAKIRIIDVANQK